MVLMRSRVSFFTLAVFVAFFLLRIVVAIGIFLQRNLTGWRQGDTSPSLPGVVGTRGYLRLEGGESDRSSTPGDSASRRHSLSDCFSLDIYHAIVIVQRRQCKTICIW